MRINKISIVGMGALGILFGNYFVEKLGKDAVSFVLNKDRIKKYEKKLVKCNGNICDFKIVDEEEKIEPADLLIIAVKGTGLDEALKSAKNQVGRNTIIISLLNGISSEQIIGEAFGKEKIIYCIAQGMDAVKIDNELTFSHLGQLCIGIPKEEEYKSAMLNDLDEFFSFISLPHTVEDDIIHRLWSKFMLNVGVNQTVMIYEGNYGTVINEGEARETMKNAMREVIELAKYEGVVLTEDDLNGYVALIDTLSKEGMPSMRQDGLAHRYSEVELFSGTVLRLAKKHNLTMKVNEYLYNKIKAIESQY